MPTVAIRFTEWALRDLEAIRTSYAEGVPNVGDRFGEIVSRIEVLREHPELGRVVPEFDQLFLRELIHPPLRIVYRRDPKQVRIVPAWRSERLLALPQDEAT
jgi:plasmid stabilization system protein ParE